MSRMSVIQGASWAGSQKLATQKQLVSSIAGLYSDIQDIEISSITVTNLKVSTLTASQFISTTFLNVSTLRAENLDISGISFDASGIFFAPTVSSTQGQFSLLSLSTLSLKGLDLGGINLSFDLGLGSALGGLLGGLGAAVGGAFIGVGTGLGLAVSGAEQGIATLIAGRPENYINSNVYETINFTSQLQLSTLGNAYPLYSSVFRTVSSSSANTVPGAEIFTSSFFYPGTTCIRTVSDPFNLITGDSNLNTSTIQSFGQWQPVFTPYFSSLSTIALTASNVRTSNLVASNVDILYNFNEPGIFMSNSSVEVNSFNEPYSGQQNSDFFTSTSTERAYYANRFAVGNFYPSTLWNPPTSTLGASSSAVPVDLTGYANFTQIFQQAGLPNTLCTAYNISSLILDINNSGSGALQILIPPTQVSNNFINPENRLLVLANQNRRLAWSIDPVNNTGTSSITTIPLAQSTITSNNFITEFDHKRDPYEDVYSYYLTISPQLGNVAFNCSTMSFGHPTTRDNGIYAFQFHGDTNIYGTLEVDTLIVLSSIIAVSSIIEVESVLSTSIIFSDEATITNLTTSNILSDKISTNSLKTSTLNAFDSATFASNVTFNNAAANFVTNSFLVGAGNAAFPTLQLRYNPILANSNFGNLTTDGSGGVIISDWYNFTQENILLKSVRDPTDTFYNSLINISTLNVNTISTNSHTSDNLTLNDLIIQNNATFTTGQYVDNGQGTFDILKGTNIVSTSFGALSSFQNNILSYTLCNAIPDQQIFNLAASNAGPGVDYRLNQANVEQWGSTIMLFTDNQNPGDILLPVPTAFSTVGFTGTFDVKVAYGPNTTYVNSFYVQQLNGLPPGPNPGQNVSTFLFVNNPSDDPNPATTGTWRFNIGTSGWIETVQASPTPYATVNSNVFEIVQNFTETTLRTTDRLTLQAGDIQFQGTVSLSNLTVAELTAQVINLPSIASNQNGIQMSLANVSTLGNDYNMVFGSIQEGPAFPQASNNFFINLNSSNALIQTRENLEINVVNGTNVRLLPSVQTFQTDATINCATVTYGSSSGGFRIPRMWRQQASVDFGAAGGSANFSVQLTPDSGVTTFDPALYNVQTFLSGFTCGNGAVAYNTVILAPFTSNSQAWVNIDCELNAGAAGAGGTVAWVNLAFPFNMVV